MENLLWMRNFEQHNPWFFQAPRWVEEDGHDLKVSPEKPKIHNEFQKVLDAEPLTRDHALVKERIHHYDVHSPILPGPAPDGNPRYNNTRSWFGAVLMTLFNLSPFLNFIEEAANNRRFNDPIFIGLRSLAKYFRLEGQLLALGWDVLDHEVQSRAETLWNCIKTRKEGTDDPAVFADPVCHVPLLINYLLKRLEHAQPLRGGADRGDNV